MPLNRPDSYSVLHAPYEVKLEIVESNCAGCQYHLHYDDEEQIPVIGCTYPNDLLGTHEPFVTLLDIAHNSCTFWQDKFLRNSIEPDSSEGDWNDPNVSPNVLYN